MQLCRRGPKPFQFWLFSDLLIYGEKSGYGNSPQYKVHRVIKLSRCQIRGPKIEGGVKAEDGSDVQVRE